MVPKQSQPDFLPDRVRNYRLLTQRWVRLVKKLPFLQLRFFTVAGGYPLIVVESKQQHEDARSFYISAGIHGDEPAPVEGLIEWAEESLKNLSDWKIQIFPCLNPWGLERNIRYDEKGRDLNRCFDAHKIQQIAEQIKVMKGWSFDLALTLHEDYDSRGFYLYEVSSSRPYWGEQICDDLSTIMSPDPRRLIDGRPARKGLIRRRIQPALLKELKGYPEAIILHLHHAKRTFTFETPSEDFLVRRVYIHRKFIDLAISKLSSSVLCLSLTLKK